jgi:tRNA (guanosine-2'-O-)-methyltransferase
MSPERENRIRTLAYQRQLDLSVLLENVDDPHNIGAILRTCDAVGIAEVYVLYSKPGLQNHKLELGKRSSSGARKWVDVTLFRELEPCVDFLRQRYGHIYSTGLGENAQSLYELDLTRSMVLAFGNEAEGLSPELMALCDGNFILPQMGMAQSLNVSVACALGVYEAMRQRIQQGLYSPAAAPSEAHERLALEYLRRGEEQVSGRRVNGEIE